MASAGSSKGLSDRAGPSRGGASIALERALQPTTKRVSARQEDRLIAEVQNILHKEYGLEKERIPGAGIIRVALEGAGWVAAAAVGDLVNAGFIFGSESGEEWECKPAAVVASSQKAPPAAKHLPSALKLRGNTASVDTSGSKFINGGPLGRKPEPSGAGGGGRGSAAGAGAGTTPLAFGKASGEGAGREDDAHTAFSFHSPTKKKSGSIRKGGGRDGGARRLRLLSPASSSGEQSPPPGPTSVLAPAGAGGGSRSTGAGGGSGSPNAARSLFGHEAEGEDENCTNGIGKQPFARTSARKKAPSASSTTRRAVRNARLPSPIRAETAAALKSLALELKKKARAQGRRGEPHYHPITNPPTLSAANKNMAPWERKRSSEEQGRIGNRGRVAKKQRTEGVDEASAKSLIGQEQMAAARAKAKADPSSSNLSCAEVRAWQTNSKRMVTLTSTHPECGHSKQVGDEVYRKLVEDGSNHVHQQWCPTCKECRSGFYLNEVVLQQQAKKAATPNLRKTTKMRRSEPTKRQKGKCIVCKSKESTFVCSCCTHPTDPSLKQKWICSNQACYDAHAKVCS